MFLAWIFLLFRGALATTVTACSFERPCSQGKVYNWNVPTAAVRSPMECAALCEKSRDCLGYNVCKCNQTRRTLCQLLGKLRAEECEELSDPPSHLQGCMYLEKTTPRNLSCVNNGTFNGTHCVCPVQYAGELCERLIRDCTEPFERNFTQGIVVLLIQPIGVQDPFLVCCNLQFGAIYGLFRKGMPFNVAYSDAKNGFGEDLALVPGSENFFMGLEKMYQVLRQADYMNGIFMMDSNWINLGSILYHNFTMGSEATRYSIAFQNITVEKQAENGFGTSLPVPFSAQGLIGADNCSEVRMSPGWYGPGCSGYSPFADTLEWPINGTDTLINLMNFNLIRTSPFRNL